MSVLFGHPTGNPNSHHAALAHFEAGRLEAFCVAWMPSRQFIELAERAGPFRKIVQRFARRRFPPLDSAPTIECRIPELRRLMVRSLGYNTHALSSQANCWLMETMARECRRPGVTAVHAYEDCALMPFSEARRIGKACVYDLPIGYYPAWERFQKELARRFSDWLPRADLRPIQYFPPEQKRREMDQADLVLVPSSSVAETVREFFPNKRIAFARYGVDLEFWNRGRPRTAAEKLQFIFAGSISLRKGVPALIEAWKKANLKDAELLLVGSWCLSAKIRSQLPCNIVCAPVCSPEGLRDRFRCAHVFAFPSNFEGSALVLLEAMACGLPVIASSVSADPGVITPASGRIVPPGDVEALIESLRWFDRNRDSIPKMGEAARRRAEHFTWDSYRTQVVEATAPFV